MGRQPVAGLLLLLITGCATDELRSHAFDGPDGIAFMGAGEGPFDDATAYVANTRSATIVPIDVKHNTLLTDQQGAPFLYPRFVATGDQRQLGQIAAWAPDDTQIVLFAADVGGDVLIEAPYITGVDADGAPQVVELSHTDPVFEELDGSGDSATMNDIELAHGATTTEDWSIEYDGEAWWVFGEHSGKQGSRAWTGEAFRSDNGELRFTIEGTATEGDRFTMHTESGLVEHDLGGTPLGLVRLPDTDLLVVALWDGAQGSLVVWDMRASTELGRLSLPEGAQPWRIALGPDDTTLFVADAHLPAIYQVELAVDDPGNSELSEIPTDAPVSALAWIADDADPYSGEPAYSHLFVAPADANRVDVLDLDTMEWLDVNPYDALSGGLDLHSPVVGMSPSPGHIRLQQTTDDGTRLDQNVIVTTLYDGSIVMFQGDDGCLATDDQGPRVPTSSGVENIQFDDRGDGSNPSLYQDASTGRQIIPSACGGVARSEVWTLTYDGIEGDWVVEGTRSGVQQLRAFEDERYVSDDGAISFLILAGSAPTTDGDTFTFQIDEGLLRKDSVVRSNGGSDALELPAAPLVVSYDAGPTGGGWDPDRTKIMALVPVTNSDVLVRVDLQAWDIAALWK